MSGIEKWFEKLVEEGKIPQTPMNYDTASYKMYVAHLEAENAALRERLEKAYGFPVKYGDKIWVLDGKHLFDRYVWAIEIKSNGVFLSLSEKTMWYDRGIVSLSERGKTWFLDSEKELAEARLAELKGGKER